MCYKLDYPAAEATAVVILQIPPVFQPRPTISHKTMRCPVMVGRPLLLHRLTAVMLDADEKPLFVRGFLGIFPSTTAQMLGGRLVCRLPIILLTCEIKDRSPGRPLCGILE